VPRPSFQPTEEQRKQVKKLSALGFRHDDICRIIGLRSPKSLRKHFREELSRGMAEANAVVARKAYEMAISGHCLAMTIFWAKCNIKPPEPIGDEEPQKIGTTELRFFDQNGVRMIEPEVTHGTA
jgi:hypothetical protein